MGCREPKGPTNPSGKVPPMLARYLRETMPEETPATENLYRVANRP